jgi:membrane-associated protease RseP (regulator of RpoE activity)
VRASDPFADLEVSQRKSILIAICFVLALVACALIFPSQFALVAMFVAFFTIIMLHEFGHYITAKRSGMKVTEFFVGFGPRLWSFTKGETEYGIKAIPLGGYCRIIGMTNLEEVAPEDEPRAYRSKKWGPKVLVAAAGPMTHFILAILLMFGVIYFAGDLRNEKLITTLSQTSQGAQAAGMQAGDEIIAINGVAVNDWEQVPDLVASTNNGKPEAGDSVRVVVRRGDEVFDKNVELRVALDEDGKVYKDANGQTRLIAGLKPDTYLPRPGVLGSLALAPREVGSVTVESVQALGSVFSPSGVANYFRILSGDTSENTDQSKRFLSPVGFGQVANQAVRSGWVAAIGLLIAINIFVGLFNLLPLLPFDGGHIAIASYEKVASTVRRRRVQVDVAKLMPLTVVVFAVLGFIAISSVFLDITNPIKAPF